MKIMIIANDTSGLVLFRKNFISRLIEDGNEIVVLSPLGNRVDELIEIGIELINTPMSRRSINPINDLKLISQYYKNYFLIDYFHHKKENYFLNY